MLKLNPDMKICKRNVGNDYNNIILNNKNNVDNKNIDIGIKINVNHNI